MPVTLIPGHNRSHTRSFQNNYEMFDGFIGNFNIFLISEPNLDDTFPDKQFHINGFEIFRCDRNKYGRWSD